MTTEYEIMGMKKDELKDFILQNGYGAHYKSYMLKADLQTIALKSIGLAQNKEMPMPNRTPHKTPAASRRQLPAKAVTPDVKADDPFETKQTPKSHKSTPSSTVKAGTVDEAKELPLPETPAATDEAPQTTGWTDYESPFWTGVDAMFIVSLILIVVAVIASYAMADTDLKDNLMGHFSTVQEAILARLAAAKEQML